MGLSSSWFKSKFMDFVFLGHVDQHAAMPPSRRTGNANSMLRGLPPLPLKETQFNLTVQERTFSAPALPFIDSLDRKFGRDRSIRRPGSSGTLSKVFKSSNNVTL